MSKYVTHEIFVCDCENINHQIILTTLNFKGDVSLEFSIKLNNFQPWYKRIFIAIKYLFKLEDKDEFGSVLLDDANILKLQNSLESFKELQKKELLQNYKF